MEQPEAMTEGTASARLHRHPSVRAVSWLARSLWTLSVVLVALGVLLLALSNRAASSILSPYLVNLIVAALTCSTVGALIASRRPENPIGWLFGIAGLLYGVAVFAGEYSAYTLLANGDSLPGGVVMLWIASWLWIPSGSLIMFLFLLFPDGRLPSPRWRIVAWVVALTTCLETVRFALKPWPWEGFPESLASVDNPFGTEGVAVLLNTILGAASIPLLGATVLAPVAALVLRFRQATGEERQQIKWVAYAAAVLGTAITVVTIWPDLEGSVAGTVLFLAGFVAIPAAVGIAILKHRLYDIDLLINRTLVYGTLTVCVVGLYVFVVGYLGTLFHTSGSLLISLIATGIVAVLFQPLREWLQRGVNRLMYGERDDPYAVLSRLGERLEATLEPKAVLPTIAETVAQALKLPYAAIALKESGEDHGSTIVAAHGSPVDSPVRLPLVYQHETVGELLLAPRTGEEGFSAADRRLLDDLARQAGIAVHAVRLTADLQRARERLVSAREEERRRLRRDLHDDLGPQLSSQALTIDAVRVLMRRDPDTAEALLVDLKAQAQDAVTDVRRLVHDLRPPALDELGLVSALRESAARYGQNGLNVSVEAPSKMPPLPAAVEVAAYRIALEAITNVVRHARARNCTASLAIDGGERALCLEVRDDGRGIGTDRGSGVGLTSMRERAEELSGSLTVEALPEGGTVASARLPLAEEG